jgi:hypothetical protein
MARAAPSKGKAKVKVTATGKRVSYGQAGKAKGGGYKKCGRTSSEQNKRGYPKCVPAAKAGRMSKSQVKSAVQRKRSKKQGVGGKPTNVATFANRRKARA